MDVLHEGDNRQGTFFVSGENGRLAELTYRRTATSEITIDHTDVAKSLAGKGVGKELVLAAVQFARREKARIIPICSYAKKVLERTDEYADVLK